MCRRQVEGRGGRRVMRATPIIGASPKKIKKMAFSANTLTTF
jgi:hypothetical protein